MASSSTASSGGGGDDARPWRTALLTLRDESLASPSPPALLALLRGLLLSPTSPSLAAAASSLPPHEVGSDVAFLAEAAAAAAACPGADDELCGICHLVHGIICKTNLEINSSAWSAMLKFLQALVQCLLGGACVKGFPFRNPLMNTLAESLQILRLLTKDYGRNCSSAENAHLLKVLISIISCLQAELNMSDKSTGTDISSCDSGTRHIKHSNLRDMEISAFSMMEDVLYKIGSTITEDLWHSVVEVLRKVMDFVAARNLIIENSVMSRFYTAFLHCLHMVLSDPKGSLSGHVAGFVATLQMFFVYGLRSSLQPATANSKEMKSELKSKNSDHRRYRPPHFRRRDGTGNNSLDGRSSDSESSRCDFSSSDSDHSDTDGYTKNGDRFRSSKARLTAVLCIQDICRVDPKLLTSFWPLLLPENDVLQPRKYQATLMTCLIFDPITKVRIEAASTIASMLEGQASVLMQVAEYKESSKCGSFTTLSCSLGQILMQLHTGILHLIQHETQTSLLTGLFKFLILLISATPYARMPRELLPTVIAAMSNRILQMQLYKNEHYGYLVNVLSCLEAAFSKMPPSVDVLGVLTRDASTGSLRSQQEPNVLAVLIRCVEREMHFSVRYEALQALRAVTHNYPSYADIIWKHVSATILDLLQMESIDDLRHDTYSGPCKGESSTKERCIVAGIKVMDECLRASSGFKGADDLVECRLLDIQQISHCTVKKRIQSAPCFELEVPGTSENCTWDISLGIKHWSEVIELHLPQALSNPSAMVRAASITCFAGMTSSVFFSLPEDKRDFLTSSSVSAALYDSIPSVRSAGCRAIGIIACFPQILSSLSVFSKFVDAIEFNTRNSLALVRVTASWALANICSSIRYKASELYMDPSAGVLNKSTITLLVETALRLTKDGEKIKSNAVRALGNLSRFIRFSHQSGLVNAPSDSAFHGDPVWLERMVQAFVSCVTTGNVKVQWNVCHALSNLFMNDTLKLSIMPWASSVYSILLLLLRDSDNYKIRMHAAVALAVPVSRLDYGSSFPDVVQGLVHVLESLNSNHLSSPSNFRYRENLEKQLTFTGLHLLGFVSPKDDQCLKDFLVKKASFLEDWLKSEFSSLNNAEDQPSTGESVSTEEDSNFSLNVPQKVMLSAAVKSLLSIYQSGNRQIIIQRFEQLASSVL